MTMTRARRRSRTKPKRYSRDYPIEHRGKRRQFNFDYVPAELYACVRRKARHDGVSLRALVLDFLAEWCGYFEPADEQ